MPNLPRAQPARLVEFLPALAMALAGTLIPHPFGLVALLLSLPLALLAAARSLGLLIEEGFPRVMLVNGAGALFLLLIHALLFAALVGVPAAMMLREPSPLAALLLSSGFITLVLLPWRWWPAFGLVAGTDGPNQPTGARTSGGGIGRTLRWAVDLARRGDPFFSLGLAASLALIVLVGGALSIAGLHGVIDEDLRRACGLGWTLFALPIGSRLVVGRALRLVAALDAGEPPAEPLALAEDAVVDIPVDPRERDRDLIARCAAHEIDLALVLLRNGADPNARPDPLDRDQRTPAIIAATEPDLRLLRELILRGADLNLAIGGLTPLIAATRDSWAGRIESVQTLLTNGARADVADSGGDTPLHHAARTRDPIIMAMLLDTGAATTSLNSEGLTALGVACRAGNEAVVRLLLERGAAGDPPGAIPALVALAEGNEDKADLARRLIRARHPVDGHDSAGRTALHAAAANHHAALAFALVSSGASVDAAAADGTTPLIAAARAGANAVIALLARAKADPMAADQEGTDALMAAAESIAADVDTVEALLRLGADRNRRDRAGRSAVDRAVAAGRWPVVARLDPDYPLPSAIAEAELLPELELEGRDRASLITTALRHGRIDVAATLFQLPPPLPESDRVAITARLVDAPRSALDWWLARVVDASFVERHGTRLLSEALTGEGRSLALVEALSQSGASVAGSARLATLLARTEAESSVDVETLALAWLARGADPFAPDPEGRPPLQLAVRRGFGRLVRTLLACGNDPNSADAHGSTPLVEVLDLEPIVAESMIRDLLAAGADPERAACDGRTPLGLALAHGRHDVAQWLDWPGPWRLPRRRLAARDLVDAAALGDLHSVDRLLRLGLPTDARDTKGTTALIRACGRGHPAVVARLLEAGADPGLATENGVDALTAAIAAGQVEVLRLMLDHGLTVDAPMAHGVPPLLLAAAVGAAPCVSLLLDRGAPADATDSRGNGALHAAAQYAFSTNHGDAALALMQRLVDAGCQLDAANRDGQTALLLALGAHAQPESARRARDLVRIAEWLASLGADVARQDIRGVSALHACAIHGLTETALALKRAGAPLEARDRLNRTPADLALMLGYADLAAELRPARRPAG